jgi:hypothetical protein
MSRISRWRFGDGDAPVSRVASVVFFLRDAVDACATVMFCLS